MKNTATNTLVLLSTLVTPFVMAQGGGALGGNPAADSGIFNVSAGKCTQYNMEVKAVQQKGKDVASITAPEGCEAIKEK